MTKLFLMLGKPKPPFLCNISIRYDEKNIYLNCSKDAKHHDWLNIQLEIWNSEEINPVKVLYMIYTAIL